MDSQEIHTNIRKTINLIINLEIPTPKVIPYVRTLLHYSAHRVETYGNNDKCVQFIHYSIIGLIKSLKKESYKACDRFTQRLAIEGVITGHVESFGQSLYAILLKYAGIKTAEDLINPEMFQIIRKEKKFARACLEAVSPRRKALVSMISENDGYVKVGKWVVELLNAKAEWQEFTFKVLEADKRLRSLLFSPEAAQILAAEESKLSARSAKERSSAVSS